MVTSLIEALLESNGNIRSTSILGESRTNQSRIFAPGTNGNISSRDDVRSTVRNHVGKADKLNTTVDRPLTNERNTASSQIEECTPKSFFRKSIKKLDSSDRMNLANSLRVQTPDLVSFRDPTIQTDNVLYWRSGGVATRISNKDGIWEPKPSKIGTAATHDEIKNISEKLAFRKYIKDLDFGTSKVLERENIERENIKEIETRLSMTRIDEQKMENIEERENIYDIPTRIEMTRSEHSSTPNGKSTHWKWTQNLIHHHLIPHIHRHRHTRNLRAWS